MIVLSLFDGISCGQIAFERLGITFDGINDKYIASEIKKIAIKTTQLHYPNTIQVGDICELHYDVSTNALYKNCKIIDNKYYPLYFLIYLNISSTSSIKSYRSSANDDTANFLFTASMKNVYSPSSPIYNLSHSLFGMWDFMSRCSNARLSKLITLKC